MRKFIFTILVGLFVFLQYSQAQVVLKISNVEVDPGTPTATVDVTIDGFTNIVSSQFSINFDSLVIGFNSVTNLNTTLMLSPSPGSNFGYPGTGNIKKGQLTFSWSDGALTGRTLPNGTRLFSIVFNVLGGPGSASDITQTNIPLKIEYVRGDFTEITNFSSQKGSVKVKGTGPNPTDPCPDVICQDTNRLTFIGDTLIAKTGQQICLPFTVKNFDNIQGGQGTFSWDTTQLKFVSIKSTLLTGTLFQTPPDGVNGLIKYSYFNNNPDVPLDAPDNTVAFEICFQVLAATGTTARICMGKIAPPEMDWAAEIGGDIVSVPFCIKAGTVLIRDVTPAPPVKIKVSSSMGNKGTTVCLDVRVENFTMIRNMQFSFTWNTAILKYVSTGMYDLKGLNQNSFTNIPSGLNFSWNTGDNSVVTHPADHKIFQICFELIGDCNTSSTVQITGTPLTIEVNGIFDGQNDYEFDTEITNGEIMIKCPSTSTCTVNSSANVSCFNGGDGLINATVVPAPGLTNCMCVWKNSQGAIVKSSANLSDCNLANIGAGAYTLELICNSVVQCTSTANVGQPDRINISPTGVTNVSCSGKGTITVTGITGGNPPFNTYIWDPNVGNTANISNLDAGTYRLTVTDLKGCTGTQSYEITDTRTNLTGTASATNVKCFGGNDGSITVTPSGGCPPYTFSGPLTNLTAGSYSITITDASVPAKTVVVSATIGQPAAPLTIVTSTSDSDPGLNNGSITLVNSGGTMPYTITWQSTATQIAQNTNPANNLRPGFYNITVTDANGCTAVALNLEVKEKTGVPTKAEFNAVGVSSNYNGFGVDCTGNCTGKISGTLASGTTPVKVTIKNVNVVIKEITLNGFGQFEFTDLCAGTYTVEGVNDAGTTTTSTITITTPTRLTADTPIIDCTNGENNDGRIRVNVNNSGTPPYTYQWSNPTSTDNVLDGLDVGTYGVTITDANNCRIMLNNLDVNQCGVEPDECGVGSIVLTPDGNQQNDVFVITCAETLNGALSLYDRWGRLVYNKSPYDNSFIGIDNNNNILNEGAYVWIYEVNYGNGAREVFSGTVTILK